MQVLTLTLPESSGKVQRILRRGPQECTNSSDRRERLSHVAAQGLAPLWGRRFRLPTYYFSAPKLDFVHDNVSSRSTARCVRCCIEKPIPPLFGRIYVAAQCKLPRNHCRDSVISQSWDEHEKIPTPRFHCGDPRMDKVELRKRLRRMREHLT